jgi:esterase/lipase
MYYKRDLYYIKNMEYVHKWTTQIKEKLDHVKDTIDSTSKKENDDVEEMKKHIEHVYNEKMRENYTNID